jgi:rod shape-determining protein MreC
LDADVKRLEIDSPRGTGRPVVLVVALIAALALTTLWYREGVNGPMHSARRAVMLVSEPFAAVGTFVTSPLRAAGQWLGSITVSRADYARLKSQNDELKQKLAVETEQLLQYQRTEPLFQWVQQNPGVKNVGATIIARPADSWDGTVLIDRGTSSGVRIGDPVIAVGGLLGQVIDVTAFDAKVRLITAQDSGVSVIVQRTRDANGIVKGSVDRSLSLDFVPKSMTPKVGDVLLTSGLGGVFPKDLIVGEVTGVSSPRADLFPDVAVASRIDLDAVEEVLVLTGVPSSTGQSGSGE